MKAIHFPGKLFEGLIVHSAEYYLIQHSELIVHLPHTSSSSQCLCLLASSRRVCLSELLQTFHVNRWVWLSLNYHLHSLLNLLSAAVSVYPENHLVIYWQIHSFCGFSGMHIILFYLQCWEKVSYVILFYVNEQKIKMPKPVQSEETH